MKLTNDCYLILIRTRNFTERYYRDKTGWLKVSARSRIFRMTAEQVLNHILPAVAGIKPNVTIKVEYREIPSCK
jgi:CRISPR/Cas system-associated protein Csx1